MASLFTLGTATVLGIFVHVLINRHEIRTGLALIALITGVTAYGLWRMRPWARGLGLFVALANSGLGAVALLAAFVSQRGGKLVPLILLVSSMIVGYLLGMRVFIRD